MLAESGPKEDPEVDFMLLTLMGVMMGAKRWSVTTYGTGERIGFTPLECTTVDDGWLIHPSGMTSDDEDVDEGKCKMMGHEEEGRKST
ncbi:hypothetical protein Tco_0080427 [Tanacetum coccineum]